MFKTEQSNGMHTTTLAQTKTGTGTAAGLSARIVIYFLYMFKIRNVKRRDWLIGNRCLGDGDGVIVAIMQMPVAGTARYAIENVIGFREQS